MESKSISNLEICFVFWYSVLVLWPSLWTGKVKVFERIENLKVNLPMKDQMITVNIGSQSRVHLLCRHTDDIAGSMQASAVARCHLSLDTATLTDRHP